MPFWFNTFVMWAIFCGIVFGIKQRYRKENKARWILINLGIAFLWGFIIMLIVRFWC